MPKKIKCAKCGHKLFTLKGGSLTSHGDNQIKISQDASGKKRSVVSCPECGHETTVNLGDLSPHG